jgi:hypothetical protein
MSVLVRRLFRVFELILSPGLVVSSAFLLPLRVYFFWQLFPGKVEAGRTGREEVGSMQLSSSVT